MRLRVPLWLARLHRWLGIGMCLFFAMWFASGITMMFVPYPSLDATARYRNQPPLDMRAIRLTPEDALERLGLAGQDIERLALVQRARGPGRPTQLSYVAWPENGDARAIDATSGDRLGLLGPDDADRQAERFSGHAARAIHGPYRDDQWSVAQGFDPYRPLWRVDIADGHGTELYVSAVSGEIVQVTTRWQRVANYAGSVVHWIYPTILRRYPAAWANTVWCLSGVGIVLAFSGAALGIMRSVNAWRAAHRLSPFRKIFRLHHLLGLFTGLFLLSWIVSGWLSVDHGLIFPSGLPNGAQSKAYQGRPLADAARDIPLSALQRIAGPAMLGIGVVGSDPVITGIDGHSWQTTWSATGGNLSAVPDETLVRAVSAAWPQARPIGVDAIGADDAYAHLIYQGLPAGAARIHFSTPRDFFGDVWVDVNRSSGALLEIVDWRRRVYRWLFNGLHTFDVPGLNHHTILRRLIMTPILLAGLALSVTGAMLGMKRLRRKRTY